MSQTRSRFDFKCPNGHAWHLKLTKTEFVDNDHSCAVCLRPGKRVYPTAGVAIPSGTVVPGCRVQYPYYDFQLPIRPGEKAGEQIVKSAVHYREIKRGAWDGNQYHEA